MAAYTPPTTKHGVIIAEMQSKVIMPSNSIFPTYFCGPFVLAFYGMQTLIQLGAQKIYWRLMQRETTRQWCRPDKVLASLTSGFTASIVIREVSHWAEIARLCSCLVLGWDPLQQEHDLGPKAEAFFCEASHSWRPSANHTLQSRMTFLEGHLNSASQYVTQIFTSKLETR